MSEENLEQLRQELDQLDSRLVPLFEQRMAVSRRVAAWKLAHGLPVLDSGREAQVLASRAALAEDPHWAPAVQQLYQTIMALSRAEQEALIKEATEA